MFICLIMEFLQFFMHGYIMKLLFQLERQNYDNISV